MDLQPAFCLLKGVPMTDSKTLNNQMFGKIFIGFLLTIYQFPYQLNLVLSLNSSQQPQNICCSEIDEPMCYFLTFL